MWTIPVSRHICVCGILTNETINRHGLVDSTLRCTSQAQALSRSSTLPFMCKAQAERHERCKCGYRCETEPWAINKPCCLQQTSKIYFLKKGNVPNKQFTIYFQVSQSSSLLFLCWDNFVLYSFHLLFCQNRSWVLLLPRMFVLPCVYTCSQFYFWSACDVKGCGSWLILRIFVMYIFVLFVLFVCWISLKTRSCIWRGYTK